MHWTHVGVSLALVVVVACAKRKGDECKAGETICVGKGMALSCHDGRFTEVACLGPLGCTKYEERGNCDDSIAKDGDACIGASADEFACTPDKRRALLCKNGKFERYLDCRGKSGCALEGTRVSCDASIAMADDPCKKEGASACSEDQKAQLVCREGKFVRQRHCRGPGGCTLVEEIPACDDTIGLAYDECSVPGYIVCAVDGKTELICQDGRFAKGRACKTSCTRLPSSRGGGIDCR
jgi:hypothetical protein